LHRTGITHWLRRRFGGIGLVVVTMVVLVGSCDSSSGSGFTPSAIGTRGTVTTREETVPTDSVSTTVPVASTLSTAPSPSTSTAAKSEGPPPRDPANQAMEVTTQPIDLDRELATVMDGMILGAYLEFLWEDGAGGGTNVVIRVEDGKPYLVRGRWCGHAFRPPPLDDLAGGAVVASSMPGLHRCTPGSQPTAIRGVGERVTDTAMIAGRPTVAFVHPDRVELVDLDSGASRILVSFDESVESPSAAKYGGGRWVISLVPATDTEHIMANRRTRYVFLDPDGTPLNLPTNPQPDFAEPSLGYGAAALGPEGSTLVYGQRFDDDSVDVVTWDLAGGAEVSRNRVIEGGTQSGRFGADFIDFIDVSSSGILVNIYGRFAQSAPARVVFIDLATGVQTELDLGMDHLHLSLASFIEVKTSASDTR
jgi:catechol 2,3-dioxygenase-like lactoylglutathione lyase family enzyme